MITQADIQRYVDERIDQKVRAAIGYDRDSRSECVALAVRGKVVTLPVSSEHLTDWPFDMFANRLLAPMLACLMDEWPSTTAI